jgi:hypothetical protein
LTGQRRYSYYLLLLHATEPLLLLLPGEKGWKLPTVDSSEPRFWQVVDDVIRAVRASLGVTVTVLRCVHTDYDAETNCLRRFYALENHAPEWVLPDGARWVSREELATLFVPEHQERIEAWFDWHLTPAPNRVPWYQPGWFQTAAIWLLGQLAALGYTPIAPVEQLRSWERSAILRVNTNQGYVYFKALPPMFAHEVPLTRWLAAHDPASFPRLLAVEPEQHWLLMPDLGAKTLDDSPDIRRWETALRHFAALQVELAAHADELLALGLPDRRLSRLAEWLEPLFASSPEQLSGDVNRFTEEEVSRLRARLPEYQRLIAELAAYNLPASLEHGDFWPGQIVINGEQDIFMDWSDSSIAHPFFSMNCLGEAGMQFPDAPGVRARLRDAYLEPWTTFEPAERLRTAYELALKLSPLHHALIYHRTILPNMENRWEMSNMLPFYLKPLLEGE